MSRLATLVSGEDCGVVFRLLLVAKPARLIYARQMWKFEPLMHSFASRILRCGNKICLPRTAPRRYKRPRLAPPSAFTKTAGLVGLPDPFAVHYGVEPAGASVEAGAAGPCHELGKR